MSSAEKIKYFAGTYRLTALWHAKFGAANPTEDVGGEEAARLELHAAIDELQAAHDLAVTHREGYKQLLDASTTINEAASRREKRLQAAHDARRTGGGG